MGKGKSNGIPVLMYHALEDDVHPSGAKDAGEQLYVLQASHFREQMKSLHNEGYRTFLLEELQALTEWPDKAVVLTFDDGHESNVTLALPILQLYGFKAEFFITTGWIGTPYFMTVEQIRRLYQAGMGVGSHGVTHRFLPDIGNEELENELCHSMEVLNDIVDGQISTFSYPGGRMNAKTTSMAIAAGYQTICSSEPQRYNGNTCRKVIPRFAISHRTSIENFASILSEGGSTFLSLKFCVLTILKTILGNKLYESMRGIILGSKSNSHSTRGV